MKNKIKYQGWKGNFIDHYFGHLEKGIWIDISILKYWWLRLNGYTVRKIKKIIIMEQVFYSLKIVRTDEGLSIVEDGNMSEFEVMGILLHLQQEHSKKLSKELADYEQRKIEFNG